MKSHALALSCERSIAVDTAPLTFYGWPRSYALASRSTTVNVLPASGWLTTVASPS